MRLTKHGADRIYGDRTRMHINDIYSIVSGKIAVDLGTAGRIRYLLFYSPPDRRFKIALVSEDGEKLISIWHRRYDLPEGVQKVTKVLETKARLALRDFIFARIKAKNKQNRAV